MSRAPQWVLDTNVLVSGLLTPRGVCGELLDCVRRREVRTAWNNDLLAEYREVLLRPRFKISRRNVENLLENFKWVDFVEAQPVPALPDADDEPFLAVALASSGKTLVTGNVKDFPPALRGGVRVLSPREALDILRG